MFESARLQRLRLNCDELVSSFAFNSNLRRYNVGVGRQRVGPHGKAVQVEPIKPTLKAPGSLELSA